MPGRSGDLAGAQRGNGGNGDDDDADVLGGGRVSQSSPGMWLRATDVGRSPA